MTPRKVYVASPDELTRLSSLPDEIRKQAKFDHIVALMQGEGANFSVGVYVSVLASFAIACMNIGFDPYEVIRNTKIHASKEVKRLLKDQGVTSRGAPKGLSS